MPIPPDHMKERLSISYVSAVAAKAGVACRPTSAPEYGTDIHLVKVKKLLNGTYTVTGYILNCQVKSTTTCEVNGNQIIYDMDAEDYNKLANWEGGVCILVLLCLPENSEDWLYICEDELVLKKCCYWKIISDPPTTNTSSKRVFIPRSQVFTPDIIVDLLEKIRRGEL
jgi:hypothetical protein